MSSGAVTAPAADNEVQRLRARLQEAQETLDAIRNGAVDAIVVEGPQGRQVFTLQGAEHPYRVLAETMNEGAAGLAPDGTVLFCNRRLAEILGVPQAEVLGTRISKYVHGDHRPAFELLLQSSGAACKRAEFDCSTPRGQLTVLFSLSPMGVEGGDGICLVATDLSEQKKLETALEHYASQLSQRNEVLSQFAYMASHDLQEPLRHIISFGDLLQEHAAGMSGEAAECAQRMQKAARRMSELMDAMLQYSRAGRVGEKGQTADLSQVAEEVVLDLQPEVHQRRAQITLRSLPRVQASPIHMRQMLLHLLSNALKFQVPGVPPEITVTGERLPDGSCEISVQDNGTGFESSAMAAILQPFYRLHQSACPGGGMGLAICRRIVNTYGGVLWANSQPGRGSTFYFTVPAAEEAPSTVHEPATAIAGAESSENACR